MNNWWQRLVIMSDFLDDYILFDFSHFQAEGVYHCPDCEIGIFGPINLLIVLIQVCVGVPVIYLLLVIWRMCCYATTEAMRVFIDIEQNIRAISQFTRKID